MTKSRRHAFTLVELMVAIALVLILMVGVSRVFKTATETISANQGISDHTRDARSAQSVFADDFAHVVTGTESPFMTLQSSVAPSFRNRNDDLSDLHTTVYPSSATTNGHALTIDIDGNNSEADPIDRISTTTTNNRNHRVDVISFFVRGLYRRQTGNDGIYVEPMSRSEAWVKYGHVRKYKGTGALSTATNYNDPGVGTFGPSTDPNYNPQNLYATDWALARNAILLSAGTTTRADGYAATIMNGLVAQHFIQRTNGAADSNLSPLVQGSFTDTGEVVQESRYDLAGITLAQVRDLMIKYVPQSRTIPLPAGYSATWGRTLLSYRFWANPRINKPITSADMARQSNVFMAGCTSFTVEFAGDYLAQQTNPLDPAYGDVLDTYYNTVTRGPGTTDGKIDFIGTPGPVGAVPPIPGTSKIRWYGLPRDVNGDRIILGNAAPRAQLLTSPDVVPLRDIWRLVPREANACAPFEEAMTGALGFTPKANYADTSAASGNNGMALGAQYNCAWGPNDPKPKMIRITITLDDPNARTAEGQTFEYVFELP